MPQASRWHGKRAPSTVSRRNTGGLVSTTACLTRVPLMRLPPEYLLNLVGLLDPLAKKNRRHLVRGLGRRDRQSCTSCACRSPSKALCGRTFGGLVSRPTAWSRFSERSSSWLRSLPPILLQCGMAPGIDQARRRRPHRLGATGDTSTPVFLSFERLVDRV